MTISTRARPWRRFFDLVRAFNGEKFLQRLKEPASKAGAKIFRDWMLRRGEAMALFQERADAFLEQLDDILLRKRGIKREQVETLLEKRNLARSSKDWEKADRYRDELTSLGIELQDGKGMKPWRVKMKDFSP